MAQGIQPTPSVLDGSEFFYDPYCSLCNDEGLNVEAVGYCATCGDHLCQTCFQNHCKPRPLRHHNLLGKAEMPTANTQPATLRDVCSDKCPQHGPDSKHGSLSDQGQQVIRVYCQDHEEFVCIQCAAEHHADCMAQYIADDSKKIFQGFEIKLMQNSLQMMTESCDKIRAGSENNIAEVEKIYSDFRKSIKEYRTLLNKDLDYLEQNMYSIAEKIKAEDKENIEMVSQKCESCSFEMSRIQNILASHQANKKCCDMFVAMKKARKTMEEMKQNLGTMEKENKARKYRFKPSVTLRDKIREVESLGELIKEETPKHQVILQVKRGSIAE